MGPRGPYQSYTDWAERADAGWWVTRAVIGAGPSVVSAATHGWRGALGEPTKGAALLS